METRMIRTYTIVITVLFVFLCLLGITGIIEHRKEDSLDQARIEGLKKANAKERDSLNTKLAIKQDSLNIVLQLISVAHQESVEAHQRSQATIRNLQRIIFITHSDSSRNAELKTLYKSYTP